ncbi:cytochrome c oxidase subunit 3 [Mycobacterium yunnanensis]|uniref:cytochrome c oxidase subunit 3 n=1 Tax=Mycobacterium yunnanensis TaxID=368477 RepID=UPI0021F26758|nr:cytochrome c oxidase subunit 3 [Mycobacterium yunnanensis]
MTDTRATDAERVTAAQPRRGRLPGDGAMWFFVLGDMIIFGMYFVAFMIFRAGEVEAFDAAQRHLLLDAGFLNTLLLLFSSWLAARAVVEARTERSASTTRYLLGAAACGGAFLVVKLSEWFFEVNSGQTFNSGTFMAFYYVLTGVHMLHVVMGMVVIGVATWYTKRSRLVRVSVVEQATTFWHMVDLLWVVIFALLYVLRA